jgi:Sec-independent protein translocase protein TatA
MIEDLLQPQHLLLILGIALLMFGPGRLPDLGWSFALSESLRAGLRRTGEKMDIGRRAAKCVINVM